jgi:hypothetical protein
VINLSVSRVSTVDSAESRQKQFYARAGVGTDGLYVLVRSSTLDWVHSTLLHVGNHTVESSQE